MITKQDLITQGKSANKQDAASIQRRTLISAGLLALLSSPRRAIAEEDDGQPGNPFIVLLKGIYQPVPAGHGPNLGLSSVNLSDGTSSSFVLRKGL